MLENTLVRWTSGVGFEPRSVGRTEYDRARTNLAKNFSVVGLTEQLGESLVLMKQALGWSRPLFYRSAKVHNRREPRAELGNELCELILEKNRWDAKLYRWAETRFKNEMTEDVQVLTRRLDRRNRLAGPALDLWRTLRSAYHNLTPR